VTGRPTPEARASAAARERLFDAALASLSTVLGRRSKATVGLALGSDDQMTVVAARGPGAGALEGAEVNVGSLPGAVRHRLAGSQAASFELEAEDRAVSRRGPFGRGRRFLSLVPLPFSGDLRGLVVVEGAKALDDGSLAAVVEVSALVAPALEALRFKEDSELYRSQERFRSIVQNSSDVVMLVDADLTFGWLAPSVRRLLDYDPAELVGQKLTDLLHPDDRLPALAFIADAVSRPGVMEPAEWRVRHRDGRWLNVETNGNNLLDDPNVGQIVLTSRDISERRALEDQLAHQAFHDSLTGLANRSLFRTQVGRALLHRDRAERPVAVLFLDLDGFKHVNDSLGHDIGDELLVGVAERLAACVRPTDTAARLGGDEFAVLLEDVPDQSVATLVAERIIEALRPAFELDGKQAVVGTSIGIAMSQAGQGADELLRNADIAMYTAKRSGRGRHSIFEASMHAEAIQRLELELDLRQALSNDEFVLHYQPIVELATARVTGLEALIRWQHPRRGLLGPGEFIGVAEETGLIVPIGAWVLKRAAEQVLTWHIRDRDDPPLAISVNISGKQLEDTGFLEETRATLSTTGIAPKTVILEITESVMMQDAEATIEKLMAIKKLGVGLAIDDFGTGYSSLRYLHSFPFDVLKVAKSFVDRLGADSQEEAFVQTIVDLSRTLGLRTLAEGIESADQAYELRRLGTELGQGFYLSRPMPWEEVLELLAHGRRIDAYSAEVSTIGGRREADWWDRTLRSGVAGRTR
jgi:diguanylate cyclase (GGDEF)-like protein/PAS domain S-box-containing protein